MKVVRNIRATPQAVIEAASEPIITRFADPVEPVLERSNRIRWSSIPDFVDNVQRSAEVGANGETKLTLEASLVIHEPFFGWITAPMIRRRVRNDLAFMAELIEARATGQPPPRSPRRPVWAPPERLNSAQSRVIMAVCAVLAITTYCGSLLTQTVHFVAETFGASDARLSTLLAITRIGTLIGIAGSSVADRKGRRSVLLFATAGICITSFLSAFAPNLVVLGALQVLSRGFVNLAAVVGFIVITEESSEGSRAYMIGVGSILAAIGFAVGTLLLLIAQVSDQAWRFLYLVGGVGLLALPAISRRLTEPTRFASMGDRVLKASSREVVDKTYGGRFAIVAITNFLLALLAAPSSQLMNRYLPEERGYSPGDILALRAFTQGLPALFAVFAGGRMAESRGRKPIAGPATVIMAITTAAFYLTGGPTMWLMLLVSSVTGALAGPAIAAFNTELFPTEVRGRAGAALLGVAVMGSATGLLISGWLAEPLGGIGASVALTAFGPLIVGLFLIRRLPEARGKELDEVSPPEV
jgi:putative MFS transporter